MPEGLRVTGVTTCGWSFLRLIMTLIDRCGARRCLARRGWDSGFKPHYGIKTGSIGFEVVVVVIRQNVLNFLDPNGK